MHYYKSGPFGTRCLVVLARGVCAQEKDAPIHIGPDIDLSQFFDPDAPPGEPVLQQIKDPFDGDVIGPGMRVDTDGRVHWTDGLGSD